MSVSAALCWEAEDVWFFQNVLKTVSVWPSRYRNIQPLLNRRSRMTVMTADDRGFTEQEPQGLRERRCDHEENFIVRWHHRGQEHFEEIGGVPGVCGRMRGERIRKGHVA